MTVEQEIRNLLAPLVGGRVFPDVAPTSTTRPYITYQQIGGRVLNYTEGTAPDRKHGFFQINVWDSARAGASALALQVEDAFRAAAALQAEPASGSIWQHDDALGLYGSLQDYSVWSAR